MLARVIAETTIHNEPRQIGDVVEVDANTLANLIRKGRLEPIEPEQIDEDGEAEALAKQAAEEQAKAAEAKKAAAEAKAKAAADKKAAAAATK